MKTLMLLRHAKSSWADDELADYDRPLNARGERDAPRMGRWMQQNKLLPDAIYSSSAVRASTTVQLLTEAVDYVGAVQFLEDLYLAPPSIYAMIAREADDLAQSIMMVGHNPGIESLIEVLTGRWERMPTAALAVIRLPIDSWTQFPPAAGAELVDVFRPKEINFDD